ncbi:thioredoxin-disulfide reductase [Nocardia sp. NPDC059240]|uniref:thioredoxin-disulfide reductase n=1 Tax=Nocardia sp. NPDC059240 TaxID=3346786 RepID=UPI0036883DE5
MPADTIRKVIIVGSGPAGYTAAIYAARAQLEPLIFEGLQAGGALMTTTEVENFPGFEQGIQGPELMAGMRAQALRFGAELVTADVDEVELAGPIKYVTAQGERLAARSVILAMGAAPKYLDVPGEQRLLGRGVSSCATCDGFFFRGQDIAVVGGGDSAMEEAEFLSRFARTVTVVHRREEMRASKIMVERAQANEKILWKLNTQVIEVHGEDTVRSLRLKGVSTGLQSDLQVTGLFVAVGHDPRSSLIRGQVEVDAAGYVVARGRSSLTSLDGVFACGDLVDYSYRQAITAAGSGCAAALDTERWLSQARV